jgi:hypothetical protein
MLFKEKMYLSNCDSVRELSNEETRKRILIGLVFGNGIILSPNILFDSQGVSEVLKQKNVIKFLNEEGNGNFIIRGINIKDINSFTDYFDKLPNNYKISSFNGKEKGLLSKNELKDINNNIQILDNIILKVNPTYENATIVKDSLSNEIKKRISIFYFKDEEEFKMFLFKSKDLVSRSEWYQFVSHFFKNDIFKVISLKIEIIDPSYNSLFVNSKESFIQDNIKILDKIPEKILSTGVTFNSLRNEMKLIQYPMKAFEIITTLGSTELLKILTDEALAYIEDKAKDTGKSFLSRKNWFGLYPLLSKKMGLEIK